METIHETQNKKFQAAIAEATKVAKAQYEEMAKNGISTSELVGFVFKCLRTFIVLSMEFAQHVTAQNRKMLIVRSLRTIYREIDPDIPNIPDFIETPIENFFLSTILPQAYDWAFDMLRQIHQGSERAPQVTTP